MDNLSPVSNPYTIDEAVTDPVMFFGRSEVLSWIANTLKNGTVDEPMVLYGQPGVGKSSILKQLEMGWLGEKTAVFQTDIKNLPLENLCSFLWALAEKINRETVSSDVKILVSPVEYSRFSAEPEAAFDEFLAIVKEERLQGKKLILAFDDLDILAGLSQEGYPEHEILSYLYTLLRREKNLAYIFTFNSPIDKLPSNALSPFNLSYRFEVGNFDLETTLTFLKQSALFNTSTDVGEYIYNLTNGHPGDIQRFCHQLYERRLNNRLLHITLADVVAVTRQSKQNSGFKTAVHRRYTEKPRTIIAGDPASSSVVPATKPQRTRRPGMVGIILVILLIGLVVGGGLILASALNKREPAVAENDTTNNVTPETTSISAVVPNQTAAPAATQARVTNTTSAIIENAATAELPPTNTALPPSPTPEPPTPTTTPTPEPIQTASSGQFPAEIIRETDDMPMLVIPGGSFIMGAPESDPSAGFDEMPEHEVTIDTFYMDKFEVTVAQYAAFLNTLGTYSDACQGVDCAWTRGLIGYTSYLLENEEEESVTYAAMEGFENYPINHVSWYGADSYCQAMGARLPTEAEWEYAARGSDGRIYPWGNDPPDQTRAVYFSNTFEDLKPVDALPDGASPFGIYGMAGSMWEWVSDWYDSNYYAESPAENPQGPEEGEGKVVRGGGWPNNNQEDRIRSANRNWREIVFYSPDIGFRCAYDLDEQVE